jgi:hypothetical protein
MCVITIRPSFHLLNGTHFVGSISTIILSNFPQMRFMNGKLWLERILWSSQRPLQNSFQHWITCFDWNEQSRTVCYFVDVFSFANRWFFLSQFHTQIQLKIKLPILFWSKCNFVKVTKRWDIAFSHDWKSNICISNPNYCIQTREKVRENERNWIFLQLQTILKMKGSRFFSF